jgi:hypothetical protein
MKISILNSWNSKILMQKIKNVQAELSNYFLKIRTLLTNIN